MEGAVAALSVSAPLTRKGTASQVPAFTEGETEGQEGEPPSSGQGRGQGFILFSPHISFWGQGWLRLGDKVAASPPRGACPREGGAAW